MNREKRKRANGSSHVKQSFAEFAELFFLKMAKRERGPVRKS
jgi:hypothetical protein